MEARDQACIALCTVPDTDHADRIAGILVEERLAACVNIIPGLVSVYRWQDGLQRDAEALLLIKTVPDAFPRLQERIRALHPYELPEIISVPIQTGQAEYLQWLQDNVAIP
ncbi:MAG: divalent-cation tolerance protein CutA [Pseudomonadota bacterium]